MSNKKIVGLVTQKDKDDVIDIKNFEGTLNGLLELVRRGGKPCYFAACFKVGDTVRDVVVKGTETNVTTAEIVGAVEIMKLNVMKALTDHDAQCCEDSTDG